MLHLPHAGGLAPNLRDDSLGMMFADVSPAAAVDFVRYCLQFAALNVDNRLDGTDRQPLHVNGHKWNFADSSVNGFYLLERQFMQNDATTCLYLLLPGFSDTAYWALLDGKLPHLEFVCDSGWRNALGMVPDTATAVQVEALVMAQLATILPRPF